MLQPAVKFADMILQYCITVVKSKVLHIFLQPFKSQCEQKQKYIATITVEAAALQCYFSSINVAYHAQLFVMSKPFKSD